MELTLNLLQFSRRDPTKSANKEVNGTYDYNKTPLAPLGTKGLVYEDPANRASWAKHGTDAYYVGPAPKHYRCLRFYMPGTRRYRAADTRRLYPTHFTTPKISDMERTIIQATDTLTALGGTSHLPPVSPSHDPRPSNNYTISSCHRSSRIRRRLLLP